MTTIQKHDFIDSIADALQFISFYHPEDFVKAMHQAWKLEQSESARDAIAQILVNSRMCAEGKRPICQDTGIVTIFLDVGMEVRWKTDQSIDDMVNTAVARAYLNADNPLRASIVADPAGERRNTGDNTPAIIHTRLLPGNTLKVTVAAKGGGSENKAKFVILNPSDNIVEWVLDTVPSMGAGWCPPGILSLGIGGTADQAMLMAKRAMMDPINIQALIKQGATNTIEKLRLELYEKVNQLGIGAQGLGGLVTVLDIKIQDYPTHAASKPVAMIPNCAATRHVHFTLDGNGPAILTPPDLSVWPDISWGDSDKSTRINVDDIQTKDIQQWKPGQTLLLSGNILTGRDAVHKKIVDLVDRGEPLPEGLDFHNRFIYYVGPVDPVHGEVVGPAGPTTSTRMDKFTDTMLAKTGLLGMIGKAERGPTGIAAIKKHQSVYLIATGGAAYLVSKAIVHSRVIAFEELGMEAVYEFEVKDMPVTVAVSSDGESIHSIGPAEWRSKIKNITIEVQ
ncbi:Fumarate hydratase class I, aerobic [hydrothermal vent metagenome]|uniref:fumarate hydratase n=1 Tax=hydrothermal vent metagenome TaxID=652676 RepID=A0A3B0YCP6_9ZZZZ